MKRETLSVNELIELAKQGNTDAFEMVLGEYEKNIRTLVKKVMEDTSYQCSLSDDYDEFLQIAKQEFAQCIYGYKENRASFFTYASKCIENSLRNVIRKERTQKGMINKFAYRLDNRISDDENMYYVDLVINNQPSFEGIYCVDERNPKVLADMIREDIDELSAEIFEIKVQGYTNLEVSKALNVSEKKVCEKINNIRKFYKHID